uniref:receptor-binding cancer antigen expressed on SiSo cells n=1 Tax=Pristiophorus japonicus TaxID=55135 RepID=UPI00398E4C40
MAISQFRALRVCTCFAWLLSFFKRLICRSGRGRKLSGDQITLPTTVDYSSVPKQAELGDFDTWQENTNAWEEEGDATWEAEEVLRQQKLAEREKRSAEQQRKKVEKEAQRLLRKEQNKIAVKLS